MIKKGRWRVKRERERERRVERERGSVLTCFFVVAHESIYLPPFVRIRIAAIIAAASSRPGSLEMKKRKKVLPVL